MTTELRWILLAIGVAFIVGLVLWELRRPRQASASSASERPAPHDLLENAPRREPTLTLPEIRAREPLREHELPVVGGAVPAARGVPVLEACDLAPQPAAEAGADEPGDAEPEAAAAASEPEETRAYAASDASRGSEHESLRAAAAVPPLPREALPQLPQAQAPRVEWPPDEQRRILSLRLVAQQPQRFAGRSIRQALAAEGFVLGRFAIFHKPDEESRAVLSAASLNRPGTFDPETMDSQHYGGLSLFAVLPGPKSPPQAFDELVGTARSLNERLHGVLQDELGGPLTPSRIAWLRERVSSGTAS